MSTIPDFVLDQLSLGAANRIGFVDDMRRLVQLNASIGVATSLDFEVLGTNAAIGVATNLDFEVLGTNAANVGVTFSNSGGQTFTTAGANGDQLILVPHLDTSQSAIAVAAQFNTNNQPYFDVIIRTGASIADVTLWAGLKKTNTPVITTDTDSLFVRYAAADHANWQVCASVSNVDHTTNTGVAVAASTLYRIRLGVDGDRNWFCQVNNSDLSGTAKTAGKRPALASNVNLIPYIGVQADTGSAKTCDILRVLYSRAVS